MLLISDNAMISDIGAVYGLIGFIAGGLTVYLYVHQPWNK